MLILFVLFGAAAVAVSWLVARAVRDAVERRLHARELRPDVVLLARRLTYFAILVVGILVGLSLAFHDANVTIAGLVAATVVASLGVQDLLRNYVSGFYLLLERNLRVGDHIVFGTMSGTITEIRMRVTVLVGDSGERVIVPNAELFNSTVAVRPQAGTRAAAPARGRVRRPPPPPGGETA